MEDVVNVFRRSGTRPRESTGAENVPDVLNVLEREEVMATSHGVGGRDVCVPPDDPAAADAPLQEFGNLLATGYLRLRAISAAQAHDSKCEISLDLSAEQSDELAMSARPGGRRA